MKKIVQFSCLLLTLIGCKGQKPETEEIIGRWLAQNGSEINFFVDSSLRAQSLPGGIFGSSIYKDQKFDGYGKWKIEEGQGFWKVRLIFNYTSLDAMSDRFGSYLLLAKESNSRCLFHWIDEPGGNRYEFYRE